MYAGKLAGMVPEDPVALGRTIEMRESFEKVTLRQPLCPSRSLPDVRPQRATYS